MWIWNYEHSGFQIESKKAMQTFCGHDGEKEV